MKLVRPLLFPLNLLYRMAWDVHNRRYVEGAAWARKLKQPVISIGNLSTGGTGKTPLAIALAQGLTARGIHVDILSRGYRRRGKGPALVDPEGSPQEFGDEPLLMARTAGVPVYVDAKRFQAGILAESQLPENSAAIHILDDGYQHRQLYREIDILLLNREDWRGSLLPAGNLREPREAAGRADVIAIPAGDAEFEEVLRREGWIGPIWHICRRMQVAPLAGPALAFCGIARPAQFFAGLQSAGVPLAGRIAFRDHHRFSQREIDRLCTIARTDGSTELLTTEKDAVRLAHLSFSLPLKTVSLRVSIDDEEAALDWILERLAARPSQTGPVRK